MASASLSQNNLMTKDNAAPKTPKTPKNAFPEAIEVPETKAESFIRIPKKLAIGVGVAAATLGLIAGTSIISFAIADRSDDNDRSFAAEAPVDNSNTAEQDGRSAEDSDDSMANSDASNQVVEEDSANPAPGKVAPGTKSNDDRGSRSPDRTGTIAEFEAARDAGVKAAGGGSAVSIDRDSRGWEVYVYTSRGEVEVRLNEALTVTAIDEPDANDRNDPAPQTNLSGSSVNKAIAAAISTVGSGAATDVAASDWDQRPGYTVTLVLANLLEIDVYLDLNLTVTSTREDD